jgi:hypothetical protein
VKTAIRKKPGGKRPGAGRPATGHDPSRTFRLSEEFIAALDTWAARQHDKPTRSEAIRRLVQLGLTIKPKAKQLSAASAARAKELAKTAVGKMTDATAAPDERAQRRHQLTKGPAEFREARIDQPKAKPK